VIIAVSTADATLKDPAHASMLCCVETKVMGLKVEFQLYGAMSVFVDLPIIANLLEDD